MKKINNKGFIATAVLYSLALIIGLILLIILRNTSTMRTIVFEDGNKAKDDFLFYKVIYHPNGGSGTFIENSVFKYNEPIHLSTCTYIKTGYNCNGWSKSINGEMIIEPVRKLTAPSKTITVYAFYKAQSYRLTFNANGGRTPTANKTITYDSTYGDLPTPTRTGYTFDGWYTEISGGNKITSSTKVSVTSNQTLYAHWTANAYKYNIIYISKTGKKIDTATIEKNFDTTNTITPKDFAGYTTPSPQTVKWDSTSKTITFTYTPITYSISYALDGGSVSGNPTTYTIETASFALKNPTRDKYNFLGWTGSGLSSASTSVTITQGSTGNRSYRATWKAIHTHTGSPGLTHPNGCYTKAVFNRQYCPGHYYEVVEWHCGSCGTVISGPGAPCSNRVCSHYGSGGSGDWARTIHSGYRYCNPGCIKEYIYDLGCGY